MKLSDFDYHLPQELIAQHPAERRDGSRLLILHRKEGRISHQSFTDIVKYLNPGDLLIANDSKVFPARLFGRKERTGGQVEILLNRQLSDNKWEAIGKGLREGNRIIFDHSPMKAVVTGRRDQAYEIFFSLSGEKFFHEIEKIGHTPLPPYIERTKEIAAINKQDDERYQTIYAKERGSVAAPTAGLHFTEDLLSSLSKKGVGLAYLTLHVGLGTFAPVKTENILDHKMHQEYFSLSASLVQNILETKKRGGRIIAVGTTTTRVLETIFGPQKKLIKEFCGESDKLVDHSYPQRISGSTGIFIYPPYEFQCIDGLITNFHLPKSTLLMLISAFAGKDNIDKAYAEAILNRYRFFSYGDAMLII